MELIILCVFGVIVSAIAHSRKRNAVGWFFIGMLMPCLGLILVLVLPDLGVAQEREDRLRRENRRLRERALKDRQVADSRHADTVKRLGAHDAVLGLDTSPTDEDVPPRVPRRRARSSVDANSHWHYSVTEDSDSEGPLSLSELRELWVEGAIDANSLVWSSGMDEWKPIGEHPDLEQELNHG